MPTIVIVKSHENVIDGKRLGRNFRWDSRSAQYLFQRPPGITIAAQLWARHNPILDQGDLGSCTGNAETGALGCTPLYEALPSGHPALDEALAVALYSRATVLDDSEGFEGQYPPTDTGSDGVSVCKAAQEKGYISGYTHCTDIATMEAAMQAGPVIVGVNWYSSFDTPNSSGVVSIGSSAYVRGGHEFLVRGIDPVKQQLSADNSWGTSYGKSGSFYFSYATMERLLSEQGDCTVPLPATAPPPTPNPPPTPIADQRSVKMWQQVQAWANAHHVGSNKTAANAVKSWAHDEGLYTG